MAPSASVEGPIRGPMKGLSGTVAADPNGMGVTAGRETLCSSLGWGDQAVLYRPGGDLPSGTEAELVADVLGVGVCRPFGDDQPFGDLAAGKPVRDQAALFSASSSL